MNVANVVEIFVKCLRFVVATVGNVHIEIMALKIFEYLY